ncbi:MAG: hypothetical protein IJN39_03340 [Clostridia bacterium]|nr:hypothetical protein [Clostridia bacterium]
MLIDRVIEILNLPITAVIGPLPLPYNPHTCFLPYKKGVRYDYLLVTSLSEFARRRIELLVPYSPEEEEIAKCILKNRQIFMLDSISVRTAVKIPDFSTKFVSFKTLESYPFGTIFVPENSIITPLSDEVNVNIRKADFSCRSDWYAEVFGQPKSQRG